MFSEVTEGFDIAHVEAVLGGILRKDASKEISGDGLFFGDHLPKLAQSGGESGQKEADGGLIDTLPKTFLGNSYLVDPTKARGKLTGKGITVEDGFEETEEKTFSGHLAFFHNEGRILRNF
jgi:hypothetical protein